MKSTKELKKEFLEIKYFKFKSVIMSIAIVIGVIGVMFLLTSCEDKCTQAVEKVYYPQQSAATDFTLYSKAETLTVSGEHDTRETAFIWDYLKDNKRHIIASGCLDSADERYTCIWAKIEGDLHLEDGLKYSTVNVHLVVTGNITGTGTFTINGHSTQLIVEGGVSPQANIIIKNGCELIVEGVGLSTNNPTMREFTEVPCDIDLDKDRYDDKGRRFTYRLK